MEKRGGLFLSSGTARAAGTCLLTMLLTSVFLPATWAQGGWKPERNVEIVIGAVPGSQLDTIARRMQAI